MLQFRPNRLSLMCHYRKEVAGMENNQEELPELASRTETEAGSRKEYTVTGLLVHGVYVREHQAMEMTRTFWKKKTRGT